MLFVVGEAVVVVLVELDEEELVEVSVEVRVVGLGVEVVVVWAHTRATSRAVSNKILMYILVS